MVIGNGLYLLHVYVQMVNIYLLLLSILQLPVIYKRLGLKILIPRSIPFILLHLKRVGQMINWGLNGWNCFIVIPKRRHAMGETGEFYGRTVMRVISLWNFLIGQWSTEFIQRFTLLTQHTGCSHQILVYLAPWLHIIQPIYLILSHLHKAIYQLVSGSFLRYSGQLFKKCFLKKILKVYG